MNPYAKNLFVTLAFLLFVFSTAPCRAQNEGQILHAGLLGYTGDIENEAMLVAPAAAGQFPFVGDGLDGYRVNLRLGFFNFKSEKICSCRCICMGDASYR